MTHDQMQEPCLTQRFHSASRKDARSVGQASDTEWPHLSEALVTRKAPAAAAATTLRGCQSCMVRLSFCPLTFPRLRSLFPFLSLFLVPPSHSSICLHLCPPPLPLPLVSVSLGKVIKVKECDEWRHSNS